MIHRIVIELTDELGGYKEELEHLERVYGAEELPIGEWVNPYISLSGEFLANCNICGESIITSSLHHNYCPNCGAKMEVKKNEQRD